MRTASAVSATYQAGSYAKKKPAALPPVLVDDARNESDFGSCP